MESTNRGIYLIENTLNSKVYVGQTREETKGFHGRWVAHRCALNQGRGSKHLQAAWNKYGEEAFKFSILLDLEDQLEGLAPSEIQKVMDQWENFFIEKWRSWKRSKGYNLNRKARGPETHTPETRKKMSEARRGLRWAHNPDTGEIRRFKQIPEGWEPGIKPPSERKRKKGGDRSRMKWCRIDGETKRMENPPPEALLGRGAPSKKTRDLQSERMLGKRFPGRSSPMKGTTWAHNPSNGEKALVREIPEGWVQGTGNTQVSPTKGRIWIHKGGESRMVQRPSVEAFLSEGWVLGRA